MTFTHTVVLTRPASTDDAFARILGERGIRVVNAPLIEIHPVEDWSELDKAFDAMPVYSGIALTSANAAHFFFARMDERGVALAELPPVHAVGAKTAEAVRTRGIEPLTVPDRASAADLADAMGDVSNQFFLQPASDIARPDFSEAVAARGGKVNVVPVYRTVQPSRDDLLEFNRMTVEGEADCLVFFSPSAVRTFAAMFPDFKQATMLIAVIGQTTAAAVFGSGLRVDVIAPEQTAESLAGAVADRLASSQRVDLDSELHADVA